MLLKSFDLHTTKKTMIGSAIIASLFLLVGILTFVGILNFSFLEDAWQNLGLRNIIPTKESSVIYIGIGIVFLIASFIPNKYDSCNVYDNKFEMLNKKGAIVEDLSFDDITDIKIFQKVSGEAQHVKISLMNSNKEKEYIINYKSEMPTFLLETYKKYKAK